MKKGKSFLLIKEENNSKHVLVKTLKEKGQTGIVLIFAPRFSEDYGWTLESDQSNVWLGFTKKSALKFIEDNL